MVVTVVINDAHRGRKIEIDLCDTEEQFKDITVRDLKRRITERWEFKEDDMRLIFAGKQLEDGRQLSDCGVKHMSVIEFVQRLRGGGLPGEEQEAGGMGDRDGRNLSMDRLADFSCRLQ